MTYAIERYPAELIDIVHLSGGERITMLSIAKLYPTRQWSELTR